MSAATESTGQSQSSHARRVSARIGGIAESATLVVDAKAKAESVQIDRPLGAFGQGLRTIWLSDPDGVTNYFAQIVPRRPATASP